MSMKSVQVKIIIQDGDKLTTIKIPAGHDVSFEANAKSMGRLQENESTHYEPDVADISLNLTAFFDPRKGHIYTTETDTWSGEEL